MTWFYGHPVITQCYSSWNLLRSFYGEDHRPWLCCGDINEVLNVHEKSGDIIPPQWQIDNFRRVVEECGLFQFSFSGFEFTWDNRRAGEDNVKERLDRGFGNLPLIQQWGGLPVIILFLCHRIIALCLSKMIPIWMGLAVVVVDDGGDGSCLRRCGFGMKSLGLWFCLLKNRLGEVSNGQGLLCLHLFFWSE